MTSVTVTETPIRVYPVETGANIVLGSLQGPAGATGPAGPPGPGSTPGGTNSQIQWNNSGVFAGASQSYIGGAGQPQVLSLVFALDPSVGAGGVWQYGSSPTAFQAPTNDDQTLYFQGATGGLNTVGGGLTIQTGVGGSGTGFNRGANSGSVIFQFGAGGSGFTQGGEGEFVLKDSTGANFLEASSNAIIIAPTVQAGGFSSVFGGFSVATANISARSDRVLEIITALSGQTQNLTEWQNNSGTPIAWIDAAGRYHGDSRNLTTFTSTLAGVVPASGGGTTNFLRADGTWAAAGTGTVTSVGAVGPTGLLTWSAPVTTSGTLTATLATQSANLIFAGPTTGSAAAPTFRALVSADIPDISGTYAKLAAANTFTVGPQNIQSNADANANLVLKSHSGSPTGNFIEFRRGSDNVLLANIEPSLGSYATAGSVSGGRPGVDSSYVTVNNASVQQFFNSARVVLFSYDNNQSRATLYADNCGGGVHLFNSSQIGIGNALNTYSNNQLLVQFAAPYVTAQAVDSATTTTPIAFVVNHASSGTAGVGFGVTQEYQLKSSTTANRPAADEIVSWATATDASRKARYSLSVYDTAAREVLRGEADGTNPLVGFLGAAAVARQTVTGSRGGNAALASLLTALANLGLITDSSS